MIYATPRAWQTRSRRGCRNFLESFHQVITSALAPPRCLFLRRRHGTADRVNLARQEVLAVGVLGSDGP